MINSTRKKSQLTEYQIIQRLIKPITFFHLYVHYNFV